MENKLQKYPTIRLGIQLCGALVVVLILATLLVRLLAGHLPSDDELRALFVEHRTEFITLNSMFLEDAGRSRKRDFYVGRSASSAQQDGIATDRFRLYSELRKKMGIRAISGDKDRVRFHITSGLVPRGWTKGLQWSARPVTNLNERIVVLSRYVVTQRVVPLEDGWYIFESDARNK